jgi:hypothetical protein
MVVIRFLLELDKEQEKETIFIIKWLNQELLKLNNQDLDVH